jgi:hypothetical protein
MRAPAKLRCLSGLAALRRDHPHYRVMPKARPLPPLEELRSRIQYDEKTEAFTWINGRCAGHLVKLQMRNGYYYVPVILSGKQRMLAAHRLVWFLLTGSDPWPLEVDHINRDRSDNRICNLRLCTRQQNSANRPVEGRKDGHPNPLKGAYKHCNTRTGEWTGRWYALITYNGKSKRLGTFDTPELAHMAYCKAAAELHGDFARAA